LPLTYLVDAIGKKLFFLRQQDQRHVTECLLQMVATHWKQIRYYQRVHLPTRPYKTINK